MTAGPTLAGFTSFFIPSIMGIPTQYLPSSAPVIPWVYDLSIATVSQVFTGVPSWQNPQTELIYTQMVYNLAGHYLISFAPDVQPPLVYMDGLGYFAYLRKDFGLNNFVAGVVQSAYDETTGNTLVVPEGLKNLTVNDLSLLKTPWGRQYFGTASAWNRPWGIS